MRSEKAADAAMPMQMDSALGKIHAFSRLSPGVLQQLASLAGMQRVSKGSVLFREGERADFIYGVVEGAVTLTSGPDHNESIAEFIGPGDLVLVPPALLETAYMVSGYAASDLLIVMISAAEFRRLSETEISLSVALNRLLCTHWRLLLRQVLNTKTHDADSRLKNYLLDLAGKTSGPARITLPGSKKDLAAHLGVRRETLSRSLKRLAFLGVHSDGHEIAIDDLANLRATPTRAMAETYA